MKEQIKVGSVSDEYYVVDDMSIVYSRRVLRFECNLCLCKLKNKNHCMVLVA